MNEAHFGSQSKQLARKLCFEQEFPHALFDGNLHAMKCASEEGEQMFTQGRAPAEVCKEFTKAETHTYLTTYLPTFPAPTTGYVHSQAMYTHFPTSPHTHTFVQGHACTRSHTHTRAHTHAPVKRTAVWGQCCLAALYRGLAASSRPLCLWSSQRQSAVHLCLCVFVCVCVCMHLCVYACVYVCMHVLCLHASHVCMCICMNVCIYV